MPPEQQSQQQRHRPVLFSIFFLLSLSLEGGYATRFDFATLPLGSLKLLGDAHLKNGSIYLSRDLPVPNSGAGRALYADPVRLRHPSTRLPLPFSTFFSFSIINLNPSSIGGGLAFLLTSDDSAVGDAGGFLGLLDASAGAAGAVVAVEFDTLMDMEFQDINGNHVGVDLNSMVSAQVANLDSAGIDLKSGDLINAWIEYGGANGGLLQVFVSYSTVRPADPVLSLPVDLGQFVDDYTFVGFSGSTQGSTEIHSIEWWSFSSPSPNAVPSPAPPQRASPNPNVSTPSPPAPAPSVSIAAAEGPSNESAVAHSSSPCQSNGLCKQGPAAVAGVATAGAFVVAACTGFGIWAFARRSKALKKWDNLAAASEIVKTPREFSYRELSIATRGFDQSRIIGHGAFGTVYKGIIPETGAMVAVKRCIRGGGGDNGGAQARAEFLQELSIIASLRHRNLVRLQGWCHEKGEILLVYDYMLNGSLDKVLFELKAPPLAWHHRKKILIGVASALAYLHRECERQVIHRDVKSSNVMLDEGYNARLGDFGLARQVEHDKSPDATVAAGTMGYFAPEYLLTGRATERTDVFSFGALVLEVACGRRPIDGVDHAAAACSSTRWCSNLVEWVWGLHGEGRILEAADRRLEGEFDEGEMSRVLLVGLACSSPDPELRPGMRSVVQMLSGEADPPFVPVSKPSMSFSVNHHLLLSLQDSVSDYNAVGLNLSSSSSSSSLRSTLRGGGGG
ncbi:L-type lectin-domain containing receptor kinase VIII.1-like [Phoenix dactylifera]|uniref:non-specific serine/threonine protein kinase n=1 Tax=Phoenix dactylifera TaxID=42345 RepID=A0A8B7C0H9_PHODC|nr:L-type lectin-domain containing receptor kinase VIII.1-like [Phoenix dactylifera]